MKRTISVFSAALLAAGLAIPTLAKAEMSSYSEHSFRKSVESPTVSENVSRYDETVDTTETTTTIVPARRHRHRPHRHIVRRIVKRQAAPRIQEMTDVTTDTRTSTVDRYEDFWP